MVGIIAEYRLEYHGIYHLNPNISSRNEKIAPLSQLAEVDKDHTAGFGLWLGLALGFGPNRFLVCGG